MITRSTQQPRAGRAPHEPPQSVEGWLDLLETLMHLPAARSRAVRDELRSHLDERVRDLVLCGCDEADAVQQAIVELGDAAVLARRLRHAHHTIFRRRIMQLSIMAAGIGAVTIGAFLFVPGDDQLRQIPVVAYEESSPDDSPSAAFLDRTISVDIGDTLQDFVSRVARIDGLDLQVHWDALAREEIERDTELDGTSVKERPLRGVLDLVMNDLSEDGEIAWRVTNGLLEIAPQEVFDLRSRRLMAYDVRALLQSLMIESSQSREQAATALLQALHEIVDSYHWEVNGGTLGRTNLVGGTLFIHAPSHMHEEVQWVLRQLMTVPPDGAAEAREAGGRAGPVYVEGAVQRPGVYQLPSLGPLTLTRLVTAAGGAPETGDAVITLVRGHGEGAVERVYQLRDLTENPALDPVLQSNDRISISAETASDEEHLQAPLGKLKPGDRVAIEIFEFIQVGDWFRAQRMVEADGSIRLPALGGVDAAGRTVSELEALLHKTLESRMDEPVLSVYTPVDGSDLARTSHPRRGDLISIQTPTDTIRARTAEEKLQPGDTLEVEIWELLELGQWTSAQRNLESDGTISLPSLGGIKAAGMSIGELAEQIQARLEGTVQDPKVIVSAFTASD